MDYHLVLDFGNTTLKAAIFRDGKIFEQGVLESPTAEEILAFSASKPVKIAILGSVVKHSENLTAELAPYFPLLILNGNTPLPIANKYESPETLGYDRIAAAVEAWQLFPSSPVLA